MPSSLATSKSSVFPLSPPVSTAYVPARLLSLEAFVCAVVAEAQAVLGHHGAETMIAHAWCEHSARQLGRQEACVAAVCYYIATPMRRDTASRG